MGAKVVFNDDQLRELQELMNSGVKQTDIAKHFKVTDDTIRRICREHDLQVRMPHKCTCILCGDTFYSNVKGAKTCKKEHHRKCVVCGEDFIVNRDDIRDTCSPKCSSIYKFGTEHPLQSKKVRDKINATIAERYGVTNVSQLDDHRAKSEQTCLSRYGATSYAGSEVGRAATRQTNLERYGYAEPFGDADYRKRIDQINLERYGVVYPMQSPEVRKRAEQTNVVRYGYANVMCSPEIQQKWKQNYVAKYGYDSPMHNPESIAKLSQTCQERFGVEWACMRPEARKYRVRSKINKEFENVLSDANIEFEPEFALHQYSYDFKCGDTVIEIDPTITHNTELCIYSDGHPREFDYHLKKSNVANNEGYTCIHIFQWDDWAKIVSMLKSKTVVYARKCVLKEISNDTASRFIAEYHIQGQCRGASVCLGLFNSNELVQVMTLGQPRYNTKYDFELLRLCSKSGIEVVGGASKLFSYFIKLHPSSTILSYCDAAKFSGNVYQMMGMKLLYQSDPAKIWSQVNGTKHITDNLLRQRGYDQLFGTNYGKGTSNEQLMIENGWLPVYDCGQKVFVYEPNT